MCNSKVRVNWRQRSASDGLVRVHKISDNQPAECQFNDMADYDDYETENEAIQNIGSRDLSAYKRCKHCWDNEIVQI